MLLNGLPINPVNTTLGLAPAQPVAPAAAPNAIPQQQGFLQGLQQTVQDPNVMKALIAAGATLLHPAPTAYSSKAQIGDALAAGANAYQQGQAGQEQSAVTQRKLGQKDTQLKLQQQQLNDTAKNWADQLKLNYATMGLKKDQLDEQGKLWQAQAKLYGAQAKALAEKAAAAANGQANLTGPERIINHLAGIFQGAGMPASQAWIQAFQTYNKSGGQKEQAIADIYKNMGFLAGSPKGQQILDTAINQVKGMDFQTPMSVYDKALNPYGTLPPGVTSQDVTLGLEALSHNSGQNVTWDMLNPQQQSNLLQQIRARKNGQ